MPRYRVKLKGTPKIIEIEAATFEEIPDPLDVFSPARSAKDANGKEIARFVGKEIAGWWIEPENTSLAEAVRNARLRAAKKADSES